MIDTIDQREKIYNRWIDTIGGQHDQKYRSIASVSIHRSIANYAHLWYLAFFSCKSIINVHNQENTCSLHVDKVQYPQIVMLRPSLFRCGGETTNRIYVFSRSLNTRRYQFPTPVPSKLWQFASNMFYRSVSSPLRFISLEFF